jgi:hypothetical protein
MSLRAFDIASKLLATFLAVAAACEDQLDQLLTERAIPACGSVRKSFVI